MHTPAIHDNKPIFKQINENLLTSKPLMRLYKETINGKIIQLNTNKVVHQETMKANITLRP